MNQTKKRRGFFSVLKGLFGGEPTEAERAQTAMDLSRLEVEREIIASLRDSPQDWDCHVLTVAEGGHGTEVVRARHKRKQIVFDVYYSVFRRAGVRDAKSANAGELQFSDKFLNAVELQVNELAESAANARKAEKQLKELSYLRKAFDLD